MKRTKIQLPLQTLVSIVGFMVWVVISSLMTYIKEDISLSSIQLSWVTAIPVILGSVLRVPIGYWTNRFGAKLILLISLLFLILPVYYLSLADSFTDLLISGLFLGVGGAIFSVGVTFTEVLSKRSAWICQWNLWSRQYWNSVYFVWSTCSCKSIRLGSYCQAFSHSAHSIGCPKFLIGG
ncbi:MFS transporter [Vibrio hannami]|nr:MFS transporter [Vibrio hannami]MDG3086591.1 MFS transporter [Vibrio hannami]